MIKDADDAGMADAVGGVGLLKEAVPDAAVLRVVRMQNFDGHPRLDLLVLRLVHRAHGPAAQAAHDLIVADFVSDLDHLDAPATTAL